MAGVGGGTLADRLLALGRDTPGYSSHRWHHRPLHVFKELQPTRTPVIQKIRACGAIDLVVAPGPAAILIAGPDEISVHRTRVAQMLDTLHFDLLAELDPELGLAPSPFPRRLVIGVSLPTLPCITHHGLGDVYLYGVRQEEIILCHSGQGTFHGHGQVTGLAALLDGAGRMALDHLAADTISAVIGSRGNGSIELMATGCASCTLRGRGFIRVRGGATSISQVVTGTGTIAFC